MPVGGANGIPIFVSTICSPPNVADREMRSTTSGPVRTIGLLSAVLGAQFGGQRGNLGITIGPALAVNWHSRHTIKR
jgi:hypothetical protein